MTVGEYKIILKGASDIALDIYDDDEILTRKKCAVISHLYLQKILREKDEINIDPALKLRDIYDCRICANHIAQVYTKGIMDCFALSDDLLLFKLEDPVEQDEANDIVLRITDKTFRLEAR